MWVLEICGCWGCVGAGVVWVLGLCGCWGCVGARVVCGAGDMWGAGVMYVLPLTWMACIPLAHSSGSSLGWTGTASSARPWWG